MPDTKYRETLREVSEDLKERWHQGAQKDDIYKLGFNAGLWNALCLISDVAEERGVPLEEIGLQDLADLAAPQAG